MTKILNKICLYSFVGLLISASSHASAQVSVEVSQSYSAIQYTNSGKLLPGEKEISDLEATPYDDEYKAHLLVKGRSLRLVLIDRRDVLTKNPKPTFLMNQMASEDSLIDFPKLPSTEGISVVLLNQGQLPVTFGIIVFRLGYRPKSVADEIR